MSNDNKQDAGFSFVPSQDQQLKGAQSPQAEAVEPSTFVPSREQALEAPPESISADSESPDGSGSVGGRDALQLKSKPIRGLRALGYLLGVYVVGLLVQTSYQQYLTLAEESRILAGGFLGLLGALIVAAGWVLFQWLFSDDRYARVQALQTKAQHYRTVRSHQKSDAFLRQLKAFYQDKPQMTALERALSALPDYADDSERIELLERQFVNPMDADAKALVTRYSMQTGVAVALSPWASIDMLLTLWRNLHMLEEISKIYGLRPTLRNRINILGVVMSNMALAGVSQTLADSSQGILEDAAQNSSALLLAKTGANLGQGIGVALVTGRIGVLGMQACRPIPFTDGKVPGVGQFGRQALSSILDARKSSKTG
ncbi:DUF697 domain-containing protein [Motiliproteus coralliicola]|uniref:DUF697 domain-containing protein n=1 Tax=Motiliproteus coralliicola TaxID=2283196 RepID=A0A369WVP6_9GAMM|nr:TIGR01620 family protein [Motiliproteus coralliicola]RDE24616.1 DUF697 domain-containing protein [Motiliproteus coralliicola]